MEPVEKTMVSTQLPRPLLSAVTEVAKAERMSRSELIREGIALAATRHIEGDRK